MTQEELNAKFPTAALGAKIVGPMNVIGIGSPDTQFSTGGIFARSSFTPSRHGHLFETMLQERGLNPFAAAQNPKVLLLGEDKTKKGTLLHELAHAALSKIRRKDLKIEGKQLSEEDFVRLYEAAVTSSFVEADAYFKGRGLASKTATLLRDPKVLEALMGMDKLAEEVSSIPSEVHHPGAGEKK